MALLVLLRGQTINKRIFQNVKKIMMILAATPSLAVVSTVDHTELIQAELPADKSSQNTNCWLSAQTPGWRWTGSNCPPPVPAISGNLSALRSDTQHFILKYFQPYDTPLFIISNNICPVLYFRNK